MRQRYEIRIEGKIPDCIEVDALNPSQAEALAETAIMEALTLTTTLLKEEQPTDAEISDAMRESRSNGCVNGCTNPRDVVRKVFANRLRSLTALRSDRTPKEESNAEKA